MSASRLLSSHYRYFLRLVRRFEREHIPLLKVSEVAVNTEFLDPRTTVRATFRSKQPFSPAIGIAAFARLTQQFDILLHAEDRTREVAFMGTCQMFIAEPTSGFQQIEASHL